MGLVGWLGLWKIEITIAINFNFSKGADEECVMHLKSDNVKVMAYDDVNEIIEEVLRVQVFRSMFLVCGRGGRSRSGFIYSERWHLWLRWWFCGGGGWIGGEEFRTGGGVCCEAGLVVFKWKGRFFATFQSDVGGSECL